MKQKPGYFENIARLAEFPTTISVLAVDPKSNNLVAVADYKGNVYLFDMQTMTIIHKWAFPISGEKQNAVRALSFSPSNNILAVGYLHKKNNIAIFSYALATNKFDKPIIINAHSDSVTGIGFNHAGTLMMHS